MPSKKLFANPIFINFIKRNMIFLVLVLVLALAVTLLVMGLRPLAATVDNDPALEALSLNGYRYHVRVRGQPESPVLIVVHGGPGGDAHYLHGLEPLAAQGWRLVFYDQRGSGRSSRQASGPTPAPHTLQAHVQDLHALVQHYSPGQPVALLGHSWGAMLVAAYLGQHPQAVAQAVLVEPGMLHAQAAADFVQQFKAAQSWTDALPMALYIAQSLFMPVQTDHDRFDYVMTRLLNRAKPGGPYQCPGQHMPPDAFVRGGYAPFADLLKPVMDNPTAFDQDLTRGLRHYSGPLLMLSSECSFIGYDFQQKHHMPHLPAHTQHLRAPGMGHNMLSLQPQWSVQQIGAFLARSR